MAKIMKQQAEFRAKGKALEQLLLKYGAKCREDSPKEFFWQEKIEEKFFSFHINNEELPQLSKDAKDGARGDMFIEMLEKFKRI